MQLTGKHLHDFISAMPGGNPQQYARLLNVSTSRVTKFLKENRMGKTLVRDGKIKASPKGKMPSWAKKDTERGLLTADDVPTDHPMVKKACLGLPDPYRADVYHMFQMLIHMTSGNCGLAEAFSEVSTPFIEVSKLNEEHARTIASYEHQISQLERIVSLQTQAIQNNNLLISEAA